MPLSLSCCYDSDTVYTLETYALFGRIGTLRNCKEWGTGYSVRMTTPLMGGVGPGSGLFKIFALAAVDGIAADANRIAHKPMPDLRAIVGRWKRMKTPHKPT